MDEIIEFNGMFINTTTGEVIDDPFADNVQPLVVHKPQKTICGLPLILETEDHLEQYGSLVNNAKLNLKLEEEKLEAILLRQKRIVARKTAWLNFLLSFYEPQLVSLVKSLLPRKADGTYKRKSLLSSFAEFKLTTIKPKLAVVDVELAVNKLKQINPDAVKVTESVLVSKLSDELQQELLADADVAKAIGFSIVEGSEKINIS